ncbi:MAG: universal stress protein [Pseudomonadota bacterium]|uniref:universal stress protein n=1 Tax=Fodinicurvata fenggangensis TaxID=1121830 RepID=UPI000479EA32|nr:universal stress protein [Fodinicurvata fenggangensis]
MSIAAILAVADGSENTTDVLKAALRLGKQHDAYVEVLHIEADPYSSIPLLGEGMSGAMVDQMMNDIRARNSEYREAARGYFEAQCKAVGVEAKSADELAGARGFNVGWRNLEGSEDDVLAQRSLLFDMVLMGRPPEDRESAYTPALEAVLFNAGRPILLVPPGTGESFGHNIVVAWDGGGQSAKAARNALAFLKRAEKVTVVSLARKDDDKTDPQDLVFYLQRHGITAEARRTEILSSAGESLLAETSEAQGDMLVMGAYSHSRLREFLLGGATQTVLNSAALPVFMAH